MATIQLRVRIDSKLKKKSDEVLKRLGLDAGSFVSMTAPCPSPLLIQTRTTLPRNTRSHPPKAPKLARSCAVKPRAHVAKVNCAKSNRSPISPRETAGDATLPHQHTGATSRRSVSHHARSRDRLRTTSPTRRSRTQANPTLHGMSLGSGPTTHIPAGTRRPRVSSLWNA